MSNINIKAFFKFSKVKVTNQILDTETKAVYVTVRPQKRHVPICHKCKGRCYRVHSYHERTIRDMNIFCAKTFIQYCYRKIRCPQCGIVVEDLEVALPEMRVSKRLAQYIVQLCHLMTIKEVAEHLELDWKTVKKIHKDNLKESFCAEYKGRVRLIAIDEISLKKRHSYLTVIVDWESGRVLWVGEGRRYETVKEFFNSLSETQRNSIEAIAMDMWDPYIKAVKECCPKASIVFDQFHVVKAFGRVIDKVRNA